MSRLIDHFTVCRCFASCPTSSPSFTQPLCHTPGQARLSVHVCGDGVDRSTDGGFVRSLSHACFTTCWSTCLASTSETLVRCMIFSTQRCIMWLEPRPRIPGWRGLVGARMLLLSGWNGDRHRWVFALRRFICFAVLPLCKWCACC